MNFHNFILKIFKLLIDELHIWGSEYDVCILYKSSEHGYYCMYSAIFSNRLVVA